MRRPLPIMMFLKIIRSLKKISAPKEENRNTGFIEEKYYIDCMVFVENSRYFKN
jgi:hypothetical protein